MKFPHALSRLVFLGFCVTGVVSCASMLGIGFDGVGDGRYALLYLIAAALLCWFDTPPVVGIASLSRPRLAWHLSFSGLVLLLALGAAWMSPRMNEELPNATPVEAWLRNDSISDQWPQLVARSAFRTRVIDGQPSIIDEREKRWTLTPESPTFLHVQHDKPRDEPSVGWAIPPAQLHVSGIPVGRRTTPWLTRLAKFHPNRVSFAPGGVSIGDALAPAVMTPFPAGGPASPYRIAKPFNRESLTWSAGTFSIRAEGAHLLPTGVLPERIPPGSTPIVGLNVGRSGQFMPLKPVLIESNGQLIAVRPPGIPDEPVAIDLLGEGESETGPALLAGWLRQQRSRSTSAPGLVVLPCDLPWRRAFTGLDAAGRRGTPRPTPRQDESRSWLEGALVILAGSVLLNLTLRDS